MLLFVVPWKTSSVRRCLYLFSSGKSSLAIRILCPGFMFGFLTSSLNTSSTCETNCYMLRRDLVPCQSSNAIDSRIDLVNERLQFNCVPKPFNLQTFRRYCFRDIEYCAPQMPIPLHCLWCKSQCLHFHRIF